MVQHCLPSTDDNAAYCASFPAAIAFSALFGLTTIIHIILAIVYRQQFSWVIIMGSAWELIGLVTRVVSTMNQSQDIFVNLSAPFILLAPLWINAIVYMCLGRMMYYYLRGERIWGIKAETVAVIFIWSDARSGPGARSFMVQAGGVLTANGDETGPIVRIGLLVYTGGVALQQLSILVFLTVAVRFHQRLMIQKSYTERVTDWRPLLWAMYAVVVLITIHIIYRIIEFASGATITSVTTHEAYYYVLDATPMFFTLVILSLWHPGRFQVGPESQFEKKPGAKSWWWYCCCCCCCARKERKQRQKVLPGTPRIDVLEDGIAINPVDQRGLEALEAGGKGTQGYWQETYR